MAKQVERGYCAILLEFIQELSDAHFHYLVSNILLENFERFDSDFFIAVLYHGFQCC